MDLKKLREISEFDFYEIVKLPNYSAKDEVEKDLDRTFPDNIFFKGKKVAQEFLRDILKCLCLAFPTMGYCQGLNYVCAYLGNYFTDEMAFYGFLYLFQECDL
jgi:hypothetical protein